LVIARSGSLSVISTVIYISITLFYNCDDNCILDYKHDFTEVANCMRDWPPNIITTDSFSGSDRLDDLVIIRDAGAAAKFDAHFERMWDAAVPMIEFEPAIKALEPK